MNSKLFIFLISFLISSCGLKRYPKATEGKSLPDVTEQYKFKYQPKEDEDKKTKKKKKDSNQ